MHDRLCWCVGVLPRGFLWTSRDGDDWMGAKIETQKYSMLNLRALQISRKDCTLFAEQRGQDARALPSGFYHESPDCFEYPKKSLLKSSHTKKYLPNFPAQKNPGIENFKPQKILWSSPSLEIQSSPTPPPFLGCAYTLYLLSYSRQVERSACSRYSWNFILFWLNEQELKKRLVWKWTRKSFTSLCQVDSLYCT